LAAIGCWSDQDKELSAVHTKKGSLMNEEEELERDIKELEERLRDRELALPAHSIRPSQLLIIEELEEEIKEKKRRLAALKG
jgi:predicted  nucleic acid-binding Zn-ribbon protein